jgi:hypothetical protein
MIRSGFSFSCVFSCCVLFLPILEWSSQAIPRNDSQHRRVAQSFGNLQVRFEPNPGQAQSPVKLFSCKHGYGVSSGSQAIAPFISLRGGPCK